MNVKRKGLEIEFDFRWQNERVRGSIPIDTLIKIVKGEVTKAELNLGPKNKEILFEEFAESLYLPNCKSEKREKTYKSEAKDIKILKRFFKDYKLHLITAEDREQFKQKRLAGELSLSGKPCSPDRVNNELSCLNQVLKYAQVLGYIKQNPLQNLKRLPTGNRLNKWLRKEQIELLLKECEKNNNLCNGHLKDLVEFTILTGARLNEVVRFNVEDFNPQKTEVRVFTSKKRKSQGEHFRWFNIDQLGPRFAELLQRIKSHPETGYFFYNEGGKSLSPTSYEHAFSKIRNPIGLDGTRIHDLRHTFCMHRAMVVKSFRQLQTEMGHSSATSIQRYLDEAQRFDITDSIFYQKSPQLSVLENSQKRTEKRTEILKKEEIYEAVN